ncbi:MAG TPA: RNA-protein complex protein Nop10 [Thermoplasmata archaeon]|nr:RNA-protein complex protein Nop10 [Thermoplasmata archaeon]
MRSLLKKCNACGTYTLQDACPRCSGRAGNPMPSRYSPEDRYGAYRRRLKRGGEPTWTAS